MSAAAQIVEQDGLILAAARCNDGFPEHGEFRGLLTRYQSPHALLNAINAPGFRMPDQWQAQLFALIATKARVAVYSEIPAEQVTAAHMEPVANIEQRLTDELMRRGFDTPIAVLPEGPMTIPYLSAT